MMDKRFFLALLLTGAVMMLTPVLFPRARGPGAANPVDTTALGVTAGQNAGAPGAAVVASLPDSFPRASSGSASPQAAVETVLGRSALSSYTFSTLGATPVAVTADSYPALLGKGGASPYDTVPSRCCASGFSLAGTRFDSTGLYLP